MKYTKNFYQIKSNEAIFQKVVAEREDIGYYNLPDIDTTSIKEFASSVTQKHIAVIGIGGSTLGTYAIYQFLSRSRTFEKTLDFFESTDPTDIKMRLGKLDIKDTFFIVISKSGTTIETISIFKYIASIVKIDKTNCAIVSERDSKLTAYATKHSMTTFDIPKDVGGRFSVFSAVGLLPLAIIGVDIDRLLEGARKVRDDFFEKGLTYSSIMEKARFTVENKHRFNIQVIFSYSSSLYEFNKWFIQLWGESLGKVNVNGTKQAFTPIGLVGPVDQHSFLQLIAEGRRDKFVSFIKVADFEDDMKIPHNTLDGFDDLEYIDGLEFAKLIDAQADATIEAIKNMGDIPHDVIVIDKVDEECIAKLMMSFMLLTSVVGKFVQINTYDQPGVEAGKIILKEKLTK
jgi:glucose-6-phosphate isomerase